MGDARLVFFGGERPGAEAHRENGDVFSGALKCSILRINSGAATCNTQGQIGREVNPRPYWPSAKAHGENGGAFSGALKHSFPE